MRAPQKTKTIHEKRRSGHHQKRSKNFANTYLPYLPMTIILFISVMVSGYSPKRGTLAYATNLSSETLLSATNIEREKNGKSDLAINNQLAKAAQAKANDMTTKNYWSHNTPDGQEPWVFIKDAGYSYLKAGENLAYGFASSDDAITGWMNSPKHRDNLLDKDFTEVGFGYANSSNYNKAGQETVIVAMYGKPYALTAASSGEQPSIMSSESLGKEQKIVVANPRPVSRIEAISGGSVPWIFGLVSFLTGLGIAVLLLRHGLALKRLLKDSQNFVTHHPLFDSTIVALVVLGLVLSRTIGFIQ